MAVVAGTPIGLALTLTFPTSSGGVTPPVVTPPANAYWTKEVKTVTTWTKQ